MSIRLPSHSRSHEQAALLTDYDIGSAYSEAYHTLYANIRFGWDSEHLTLLLTTPSTYADHAVVAANVAIAAAQSGTPTILVDADLRTPSLLQRFGLGEHAGLGNLLAEESVTAEKIAAYLCATFSPDLRLLGAGTSIEQGAALLLSPKLPEVISSLRQFLAETETRPGIVIFDSPPVLAGADASLIGTHVEQTFLIIAANRTTRVQAKQAQEQLQRAHANLAGIIMLDV